MNKKLKLGLFLFIIGFVGVISTILIYPSMDGLHINFSEFRINWMLFHEYFPFKVGALILSVTLGTLLYDKVNLKLPILEGLIDKNKKIKKSGILRYGFFGGLITGALIMLVILVFIPLLGFPLAGTWGYLKVNMVARVFDGAITSEILNRFGLMTFLVWLMYKITGRLTPKMYLIAIVISMIPTAIGNFVFTADRMINSGIPIMEGIVLLLVYNLLLSAAGNVVFGWLYWKKGLESAIIAHVLSMIIIMMVKYGFNI